MAPSSFESEAPILIDQGDRRSPAAAGLTAIHTPSMIRPARTRASAATTRLRAQSALLLSPARTVPASSSAWNEERTSGPLATWPMPAASALRVPAEAVGMDVLDHRQVIGRGPE